jgi:hypothetical protein
MAAIVAGRAFSISNSAFAPSYAHRIHYSSSLSGEEYSFLDCKSIKKSCARLIPQ